MPNNILEITKAVDMTGRGEPIYSHTIQVGHACGRGLHVVMLTDCWITSITSVRVFYL